MAEARHQRAGGERRGGASSLPVADDPGDRRRGWPNRASSPGEETAELRRALRSPDASRRAAAAAAALPDSAILPQLLAALEDVDPDVRRAAASALARAGLPRGLRALVQASAGDISWVVRREAVAGMGRFLASRWRSRSVGAERD